MHTIKVIIDLARSKDNINSTINVKINKTKITFAKS